ncbi:MAG: hypothetical protein EA401_00990 [Planctomycetota bacterium]|nr:MAG: hypothetical protein EA401_00990 [Planctomycetota bacterium]
MTVTTEAPIWRAFYDDGCKYLRSAEGGRNRPQVFTPDITFNLAAMAIEKLSMALLLEAGDIADNHTMHDLVLSLSRLPDLDLGLLEAIDNLGRFEDLCPMAPPQNAVVLAEDVPAILAVARELHEVSLQRLPLASEAELHTPR